MIHRVVPRKRWLITLLTAIILLLLRPGTPEGASDLEQGKHWYDRRSEGASELRADAGPINRAIDYFVRALKDTAREEEAGIFLLKSYYFKGMFVATDELQKKQIFAEAKALGERLLQKYPESPAVRLYYSANLGKWGETVGIVMAAQSHIPDVIKAHAEEIIHLDPAYERGAGYYLLGSIHSRAPYIPFLLSWPDNSEGIRNLRVALSMNPDSLGVKLMLAKALLRYGENQQALALLTDVTSRSPGKDRLLEDRSMILEAGLLLHEHAAEQANQNGSE